MDNDNKKRNLFLSVIGVVTLLTLIVGTTFAYFSTKLNGEAANQSIGTATLSDVVFSSVNFNLSETDILPGKEITGKSFSVGAKNIPEGVSVKYDCEILGTLNGVTSLEYKLSSANAEINDGDWKSVPDTSTSLFGTPVPTLTSVKSSDTYLFDVRYKETGASQNADQGKTLNISVSCKLVDGDTIYYNEENKGGTQKYKNVSVTVNAGANGQVESGASSTKEVLKGGTATFTLNPNTGYSYISNTCGGTVLDNVLTIPKVTDNMTCTVNFDKNTYKVSVSARNGLVEGKPGITKEVKHGDTIVFNNVKPKEGYKFESIENGEYDGNNVTVKNVTERTIVKVNFTEITPYNLTDALLRDNRVIDTRTDFSIPYERKEIKRIYKENRPGQTQDNKPVYYFAGDVQNNYVKFGKDSSGQDMFWRIVRINEDRSVRLIYAGHSWDDSNGMISTKQAYNTNFNQSSYTGYMYTAGEQHGLSTSSPIKTTVDNWYKDNLLTDYDKYISKTAIYCNDRDASGWSSNGSYFDYNGYTRAKNAQPTFKCNTVADQFTTTNSGSKGNQALKYPVAMLTSDEVMYAGGKLYTNNNNYYLRQNAQNNHWWTMTSVKWDGHDTEVFYVDRLGALRTINVDDTNGVRPTISLKSCVLTNGGKGTNIDPYLISIDGACNQLDN